MGTFCWHSTWLFSSSFGQKHTAVPYYHSNNSYNLHEHWLHQHAFKQLHKGHNNSGTSTLCDTLCYALMVSTFVCFQLTFVNQFWYLMLTMFCSQSKMHLRLAAVVGITFQEYTKTVKQNKFCIHWGYTVPVPNDMTTQQYIWRQCDWLASYNIYCNCLELQLLISAQTVSFFFSISHWFLFIFSLFGFLL